MKHVYILTGNTDKIKAANHIFHKFEIEVLPLELDIPEIQASTSAEIARHAVEQAYKLTDKPVIREDHSFYITELHFPGPFMAYADKSISAEQLLKIVDTLESRKAYFELAAAYADNQGQVHEFSYQVPIVISSKIRGNDQLGWERLMMLPGDTRTFAEPGGADRTSLWARNYEAIAQLIHEQK